MSAPDGAGGVRGVGTGTYQDLGVTVQRDLTGSGRLARGGHTRFSTLRLRSAGRPAPLAEAPEPGGAPPQGPAAERPPPAGADARASPVRRLLRWLGLG